MTIYRGLNTSKKMNDVDDPASALINLGLNQRDLTLISRLTANGVDVSIDEFHTVAGLVDDQKKVLQGLSKASEFLVRQLDSLPDIKQSLAFNYRIDSQIKAGALKYNYWDFATNNIKQADISTSRVSSWSTIGESIVYGGEVRVVGDTLTFSSIGTTNAPIPKTFRSEVPTHLLRLEVDGQVKDFLAMKGIPLVFDTFFRNADLYAAVTTVFDGVNDDVPVPITWRITNKDTTGRSYNSGDGTTDNPGSIGTGDLDDPTIYTFRDSTSKARKLELFYDPSKIIRLQLASLNLSTWTSVPLPTLKKLYIQDNDFYELPNFNDLAPTLTDIDITGNNLSRAVDASGAQITATQQLNTLPTTLVNLKMNGVFSDSTTIDLRNYTNLAYFQMSSFFARDSQRRMTGGTVTPKVAEVAASIKEYRIYNQPYSQLCSGVINSTVLTNLSFEYCGITEAEGGGDITIDSLELIEFWSYGNPHKIVDMSYKENLKSYIQHSSNYLGGGSNTFSGKFTGCTALFQLIFYASNITGSIQTDLTSLSALTYFDARYSAISGEFRDDSFNGTEQIKRIYLAGSDVGATAGASTGDFFGTAGTGTSLDNGLVFHNTPELIHLYVYSNKNIRGEMPDMSKLTKLQTLYISSTGLRGSLPPLSGLEAISYVKMDYTKNGADGGFTGNIPAYDLPRLNYLFLTGNALNGQVPKLKCPYLFQIYIDDNELSGNIPDFSDCSRLKQIVLRNNGMTGYQEGSLRYNSSATIIDISNNLLTAQVGPTLINDLLENWVLAPRGGVTVNMLGQDGLSESSTRNDGSSGEGSTANKLDTLRQKGWSILMD